jgi:hypothetical protein
VSWFEDVIQRVKSWPFEMSSIINIDDSSDDEIPGPCGLRVSIGITSEKRSATSGSSTNTSVRSDSANSSATIGNTARSHQSTGVDTFPSNQGRSIVSPTPVLNRGVTRDTISASSSTRQPPKKKAKVKPSKAYSLIWVCTHGKGQRRSSWRKKDLKIMGVYPSKSAAEEGKRNVMNQYECCGHGDICVGDTWEDEIDLIIRESPLNL